MEAECSTRARNPQARRGSGRLRSCVSTAHGGRGECILRFARRVESVERTNLLEEPEGAVEVSDDAVRLRVRPFEVVTLRVQLGKE